MCGKFTQMASWRDVHAFSQSLAITEVPDEIVVSTPMRFANIIRLNEAGERKAVSKPPLTVDTPNNHWTTIVKPEPEVFKGK